MKFILLLTIINPFVTALIGLIIAAILGYILRGFFSGGKKSSIDWKSKFEDKEIAYDKQASKLKNTKSKLSKVEAEHQSCGGKIKPLEKEIVTLKSRLSDSEYSLKESNNKISSFESNNNAETSLAFKEEIQSLKLGILDKENKISELNKTISMSGNSDRLSELERKLTIANNTNTKLTSQVDDWRHKYDNVSPDLKKQISDNGDLKIKMHSKDAVIKELREKLDQYTPNPEDGDALRKMKSELDSSNSNATKLNSDNSNLKSEIEKLKKQLSNATAAPEKLVTQKIASAGVAATAASSVSEKIANVAASSSVTEKIASVAASAASSLNNPIDKKAATLARIKEKAKDINFEVLGTATEGEKDDLQKINGIGPFIESKLNALGIYKFSQLSKMDDEITENVNGAIEFFPGRAKRDDWKGQAKGLMG